MMSFARGARQSARACRSGVRSLSSRAQGTIQRRPLAAALVSGGIALGVFTGYTLMAPVHLDAPKAAKATAASKAAPPYVSYEEVQKHNTRESCWVIINGQVYDATSVLEWHPGGAAVILKASGKDATKTFTPIHPPTTLASLPPESYIGPIDPATLPAIAEEPTDEEIRIAQARETLPPPAAAINLQDIEKFAEKVLSNTAWAYYRSVADDENTYYNNFASFKRFWFRPRVLNKISELSTESTILGLQSSLPIFIAPAALARLGHPDGEMNLVRAAGDEGILQGISNNASCSTEECVSVRRPGQSLIFQLYVNRDRPKTEILLKKIEQQGFKGIMLTVDAAVPGNRELDQRAKGEFKDMPASNGSSSTGNGAGIAHAISGYQDPDVVWADIPWLQSITKLPLIIKGIQCVEDAEKAFEYGVQGIVISNHGGRSLDFSPAPMDVLYELHQKRPDLIRDHHVFIDGGVRRGTDVIKALCLGARAVGLGRPFLFANSVWGEAGCRRVIQIMRQEIETGMRLLGVTRLDQLTPELLRYVDNPQFVRRP